MRRLAIQALLGLVLTCALAAPALAASPRLSPTGNPRFPDRSYLLTLPARAKLQPSQVSVRENGAPVGGLSVLPASVVGESHFGTVLVIDASDSTQGSLNAARTFAARRNPKQPLGVIMFNKQISVVLAPTTDSAAIARALSSVPNVGGGTRIYDATTTAIGLLAQAHITAGSVIVLSDGTDSRPGQAAVAAAAQAAHVRIYTIAVVDPQFNPGTMRNLAIATGGQFIQANSKRVDALFADLGAELSNEYLVSYRSTESLGSAVKVTVNVAGYAGAATAAYYAPAIAPFHPPPSVKNTGFWQSSTATLLLSLAAALLLGLAVLALLAPRHSVRARVSQFVSAGSVPQRPWATVLLEQALGEKDSRRLGHTRTWARFEQDVELAGFKISAGRVAAWTVIGTVLLGWLLALATSSPVAAIFGLLAPVGVFVAIRVQVDRQRRQFDEQLPDNLQVIASAMRAGHTFIGALAVVVEDAPEPSRRELRRALADEQLGIPLDKALDAVAGRMHSQDFAHVALVASLQRDTGGNTAEVVDRVTETIRERLDLRRLVRALTAQGRLAGWIVAGLPVALMGAIALIDPSYLTPLFHRTGGIVALVIAALMLATGTWLIRRIVNIKI
jgi:tight adherence protein B